MSLGVYLVVLLLGANVGLFGVGGLVHYYYYVKRREEAEQWKIQPGRYLSDKLYFEGLKSSIININLATSVFAVVLWGLMEKGWGVIYFDLDAYGYPYVIISAIACFIFIEAWAYYSHVALHKGWLYTRFHSKHHRYKAPTWFTMAAMDPVEWLFHSSYIMLAAFIIPMHWSVYFTIVIYTFLAGFWDHIGAKLPFELPFHGSNRFHDDHHKYVHVNFGFLCSLFDRIHDTIRHEGHHYTEESFAGGKGIVKSPEQLGDKACGPIVDY